MNRFCATRIWANLTFRMRIWKVLQCLFKWGSLAARGRAVVGLDGRPGMWAKLWSMGGPRDRCDRERRRQGGRRGRGDFYIRIYMWPQRPTRNCRSPASSPRPRPSPSDCSQPIIPNFRFPLPDTQSRAASFSTLSASVCGKCGRVRESTGPFESSLQKRLRMRRLRVSQECETPAAPVSAQVLLNLPFWTASLID